MMIKEAVKAEKNCSSIYEKLRQRTELLAGNGKNTILVQFNWRLRVGGTRGFRELLLPVFHPVFGIPYIPASSLKGAARAWARANHSPEEIRVLLGMLEGKIAKAAKVEFLDAFPIEPCLSVDVATPQWHWQNNQVIYKPEPHPLLSMMQPQFLIGLRATSQRKAEQSNQDWQVEAEGNTQAVKAWLENALKVGIGSRVSSGYGHAIGQRTAITHSRSYNFELWTQGMYGSEPPSKQNGWKGIPEFRPTALRGILRYWFRAIALSLYDKAICSRLEDEIFGNLSRQGSVSIDVIFNDHRREQGPYHYNGKIYLQASEPSHLNLMAELLILASHLGGIGRGSRRPLHLLDINGLRQMRGCHWEIDSPTVPLPYDSEQWNRNLFNKVTKAFAAVQSPVGTYISSPGNPGKNKRQQDVLDRNAQVWLIKSPRQIAPTQVKDWNQEGDSDEVRGVALNLLYSSNRFKGEKRLKDNGVERREGNPNVGGALETPSFVWIKSIFPTDGVSYQVITIFGVDHPDRKAFADELEKLRRQQQALLVFGQMPSGSQRPNLRPRSGS
jgi:CRISPR-associated protein Cmr6